MPGRVQSMVSQRVGHDWVTSLIPSNMSFATPASFWFPFAWNNFFHLLTLSVCVRSCFCILSVTLYLLVGAFNPFAFKVIINVCSYWNFLNCFGFVFVGLFLLLCFLPREVLLVFFVRLIWWYRILLGFAFLSNLNEILTGRVVLVVCFPLSFL